MRMMKNDLFPICLLNTICLAIAIIIIIVPFPIHYRYLLNNEYRTFIIPLLKLLDGIANNKFTEN